MADSSAARSSFIVSRGKTHLTLPNLVVFRLREASSMSRRLPGYQRSSTRLEPSVKRWVMSSTVRSGSAAPSSAAAQSASSRSYSASQSGSGMMGATVRPMR